MIIEQINKLEIRKKGTQNNRRQPADTKEPI
jgi:hypothetical protein